MTLKADFKYIKDNWHSPYRRPLWQIVLYIPITLIYYPCRMFVDWMDR